MAGGIRIEVTGLDKLIKKFGSLPQNIVKEVDGELAALSVEYVNRAVADVPVDTGVLKNGITFKRISEMNYEVVSNAHYSAYVEFGTIKFVNVPAELAAYAAQFKGRGIKKEGGMPARPFFFKHLPWAENEINQNLKQVVKRAMK